MIQSTFFSVKRKPSWSLYLVPLIGLLVAGCGGSVSTLENGSQDADPVVVDIPIAFIQRDLAISEGEPLRNIRFPAQFIPGASLFIQQRANSSVEPVDLTPRLLNAIFEDEELDTDEDAEVDEELDEEDVVFLDIKNLKADYDGTRIVFSARALEDLDDAGEPDSPTWNIWEYDFSTDTLRRVISSDLLAEDGHDTSPVYLADGRIAFTSTRQRGNQARLLDEGKPQYSALDEALAVQASVIHIMNADGSDIEQISFNQSHDIDPLILLNGKLLFSRWDRVTDDNGVNLYQMNPDGSDLEILYGRHSHDSVPDLEDVQFVKASINPDEQVFLGLDSFETPRFGTDFVTINVDDYIDFNTPITSVPNPTEPAQQSALFDDIVLSGEISPMGFINAFYPLWDGSGRIIYSWSQCRLYAPLPEGAAEDSERTIAPCSQDNIDAEFEQAPPVYGLWIFDPTANTQLVLSVPNTDFAISEVVAVEPRAFPANPDSTIDLSETELIDGGFGVLHIQSVYDIDGEDTSPFGLDITANPSLTAATERPARFLRIVKSVSIPDEEVLDFDTSAFGRSRDQLMREMVGYTPIQPDGSVEVAIPAGVPFSISIVDEQGERVSARHNNWLQLKPGERKTCIGCHTTNSENPHGRIDAQPASINLGAPTTGTGFPGANPALFTNLGETMAQTLTRISGIARLTPDIEFEDIWVDPDTTEQSPSFSYSYLDLQTTIPITDACAQEWTSVCRAVINYPDHIADIFTTSRETIDEVNNIVTDITCNSCHSNTDIDGETQIPAAQLELVDTLSIDRPDFLTSYRELLFDDNEQEISEGALVDTIVAVLDNDGNPTFEQDEEGELILDANGDPIPITQNINVNASLQVNGAGSSNRFFSVFLDDGSHASYLTDAELRLLREWIDMGGQYYNNPFDAPEN